MVILRESSSNGTVVNGRNHRRSGSAGVTEVALQHGDILIFGGPLSDCEYRLHYPSQAPCQAAVPNKIGAQGEDGARRDDESTLSAADPIAARCCDAADTLRLVSDAGSTSGELDARKHDGESDIAQVAPEEKKTLEAKVSSSPHTDMVVDVCAQANPQPSECKVQSGISAGSADDNDMAIGAVAVNKASALSVLSGDKVGSSNQGTGGGDAAETAQLAETAKPLCKISAPPLLLPPTEAAVVVASGPPRSYVQTGESADKSHSGSEDKSGSADTSHSGSGDKSDSGSAVKIGSADKGHSSDGHDGPTPSDGQGVDAAALYIPGYIFPI